METHIVADTLKIINLSPSSGIPKEYLALLGVVLGALLSVGGSMISAFWEARVQIKNSFFMKRLDVYMKLAELCSDLISTMQNPGKGENDEKYPCAYHSSEGLKTWLNTMVEFMDKNRFLIDNTTCQCFKPLNCKLIETLKEIRLAGAVDEQADILCRDIGRRNLNNVQSLARDFFNCAGTYISNTYNVDIETLTT